MRRILFSLALLFPVSLVSQVKILMPVVVKDASGKAVTDLKISDFQVSGPKNVGIDQVWLVPPQTVTAQDISTPVTVLFDAADTPNSNPDVRANWLRAFLADVAQHRAPVTFYIYTAEGLKLVYDPSTSPEVLTSALGLIEKRQITSNDPRVEDQVKRIELLSTSAQVRSFRFDNVSNGMNGILAVAHSLAESDKRKAVMWLTSAGYTTLVDTRYSPPTLQTWYSAWQATQEASVEQFNAARISVYPLNIGEFTSVEQLALCTGGRPLNNGSIWTVPMWSVLQALFSDFGPYYMLAVAVPTPRETDWIPVKIKVDRPGLTVRAAPGFYGLKPGKASKTKAAHP